MLNHLKLQPIPEEDIPLEPICTLCGPTSDAVVAVGDVRAMIFLCGRHSHWMYRIAVAHELRISRQRFDYDG